MGSQETAQKNEGEQSEASRLTEVEFSQAMRSACSDKSNEIVFEVFELFFQLPHHLLEADQQYAFFQEAELLVKYFSKPILSLAEVKEVIKQLRALLS